MSLDRRAFTRLLALAPGALLAERPEPDGVPGIRALRRTPAAPDERYWEEVRAQFILPSDLAFMNAANLCPAPLRVLDLLQDRTRRLDRDPSPATKSSLQDEREITRQRVAALLRVTPEEIVLTRNTSEANNLVSSGVPLGPGDEVVIFSDNHPSNNLAWKEKAARFGFTVNVVEQVNPHPGADYYVQAFGRAITPRTKVVAFTHVSNTVGDLLPAREICALARARGALSLVDGAQSFGVLDVDLSALRPDFYSGSAHKWSCGPKETGLLFVSRDVQDRIKPSVYSLYGGRVGASRTMEAMGQRDEPAMIAFGEAVAFSTGIGLPAIEARSRELAGALREGLARIPGVEVWTHADASRTGAVVSFRPGTLDASKLITALYQTDRIVGQLRGGADRPGIRFSPHLYNLHAEVERTVATVKRYMASGI
ncbi:MAG TPA: aminotransferase class V-fold PLP-dependent enzyme [Gemmatimonadales bacterium]|nr:aminotransferase class V-fold PLP-dependent enzyme [Gemmatimonadales bacterium]